jgi:hypothetical protein
MITVSAEPTRIRTPFNASASAGAFGFEHMSRNAAGPGKLRSRAWFDNPDNVDKTALYLER